MQKGLLFTLDLILYDGYFCNFAKRHGYFQKLRKLHGYIWSFPIKYIYIFVQELSKGRNSSGS